MYKLLLIRKYLFKRRIAWVSLVAVCLCTAMVLVIISVMGGWLRMFRSSFHGLAGDVIVSSDSITGFSGYEAMLDAIRKLPEAAGAVPTIESFGLLNIGNEKAQGVQVYGYPIDQIGQVNGFPQSLYRQYQQYVDSADDRTLTPSQRKNLLDKAAAGAARPSFALPEPADTYRAILSNAKKNPRTGEYYVDPAKAPGMIAGIGVLDIHRDDNGQWENRGDFLYRIPCKLTVLAISPHGFNVDQLNKSEQNYWIVDDSRVQLFQYDQNSVYVPFDVLQKDLGMTASTSDNGEVEPARVSHIEVKARPGVALEQLKVAVARAVHSAELQSLGLPPGTQVMASTSGIRVETWEDTQRVMLDAVQNEVSLVTFLFSLISIVAIFLIFCIFYMIVVEKTRDIGIVKSVGATSAGIAGIFLGYGFTIGVVGAGAGLALGWAIVHNINQMHEWLHRTTGYQIWKPSVYQFDIIPNEVSPRVAAVIFAVGIVSAVIGALVPAYRAARLDPVESLRFE